MQEKLPPSFSFGTATPVILFLARDLYVHKLRESRESRESMAMYEVCMYEER